MKIFTEMCQAIEREPGKISKKQLFKEHLMLYSSEDQIIALKILLGEVDPHIGQKTLKVNQSSLFTSQYNIRQIYDQLLLLTDSRTNNEKILSDLFSSIPAEQLPYLKKILLGNINIGLGETLILDSLDELFGGSIKSNYYVCPNIEKVLGGQIEMTPLTPVRPALAKVSKSFPVNYAVEYKYDGFRFQFHKSKTGEWRIYSRKLEDYTYRLQKVGSMIAASVPSNIILDGELVTPGMRFQDAIRIDAELIPVIFDILYYNEPVVILPYDKRRQLIHSLNIQFADPIWYNINVQDKFNEAINFGYEGIMIKDLHAPYEPVVRHWIKVKPGQDSIDLVIVGAEHGLGKREGLYGSLICGCLQNGNVVDICKVGTGFSDEELKRWKYLLDTSDPTQTQDGIRVEPRYVIELGYSGFQDSPSYTCGKSLRFPVYIRQRPDKPISEIYEL